MSVLQISVEGVSNQVEFRAIEGFPGYAVGSDGSVLTSLTPGKPFSHGVREWRFKKLQNSSNGYKQVSMTNSSGESKICSVHVLVLTAFVCPRPHGMVACHFPDKDRTNNHVSNLRWDTIKSNALDRRIHGTTPVGSKNPSVKITNVMALAIRHESATTEKSYAEIAKKYSVSKSLVYQIVNRKIWTHV